VRRQLATVDLIEYDTDMFVISLGGSIVVPDAIDTEFVAAFADLAIRHVREQDRRLIVIVGGGAPARRYQEAYRTIRGAHSTDTHSDAQDWIGIMATRLNAELLRHALHPYCVDPVVYDPTADIAFAGSILVGAGWKPGFSTDNDAVLLAERFGADTVVNLSNIKQVYTADPKVDPDARPLESVSWDEFRTIVGDEWIPGKNLPFDPVATRRAAELGMRVIAADGKDLTNTEAILTGRSFIGTVIGPD